MNEDRIRDLIRSFVVIAPGYAEWRQRTIKNFMSDFNMDPSEATAAIRESWEKPLGRHSNDEIADVFARMEAGKLDVPPYGEAPRTIARHCQKLVDARLAAKRNREAMNPGPPPGDTSPQLTPEEFKEMRKYLGDVYRAIRLTSKDDYDNDTPAFRDALQTAANEKRNGKVRR